METEEDPRVILNYFKTQGKVNRDAFLRLDDDLAQASILPDAYKAIEERAIKAAQKEKPHQKEIKSSMGYEEDFGELEDAIENQGRKKTFLDKKANDKKVKINENSSWETVLRQSEIMRQNQVYDHYYIGRKRVSVSVTLLVLTPLFLIGGYALQPST